MKNLIISLTLLASACVAQVTTTTYYDNRAAAFVARFDDCDKVRMPYFINAARLCGSNNVVASVGVNGMSLYGLSDWQTIQTHVDAGYLHLMNHSENHPVNLTNYFDEYVTARQVLYDGLAIPWQYKYRKRDYSVTMLQWGGITNVSETTGGPYCSSNLYLAVSGTSYSFSGGVPAWSNSIGSFGYVEMGLPLSYIVTNGTAADSENMIRCNNAVTSNKIFITSGHPWNSTEDTSGSNSVFWATYYQEVFGNRKNVWYTDLDALFTYLFCTTVSSNTITVSTNSSGVLVKIDGDHTNRVKYGLSYPITYKVTKPVGWPTTAFVYYTDPACGANWYSVAEKTTNDYFTGINCYRNDATGAVVYVSHALPQGVDTFSVLVSTNDLDLPVEPVGVYTNFIRMLGSL
jgi:hypothetical protein